MKYPTLPGMVSGCRHNLGYWEGRDYLGVGPAATSTIGGERWTNPEGEGWLEQVREGRRCPEREPLDRATRALELMMLRLRTVDGLPLDAYESLAGRSFLGGSRSVRPPPLC